MPIIDLSAIDPADKASGLAGLIRAGERVPQGFCLTTDAFRSGAVPRTEVLQALAALGGGPVAVRSSATTEDSPTDSAAGQQDSFLDVHGDEDVPSAITACWQSLHTERALAYRSARGIDDADVAMAVVVQRMIPATVAGVMFTANPLTGSRSQMLVEAARGPGAGVVEGSVQVDRYILGDGCLHTD